MFRRSDFIEARYAFSFVLANFGIAIAARMPMITTTIRSSIRVKPFRVVLRMRDSLLRPEGVNVHFVVPAHFHTLWRRQRADHSSCDRVQPSTPTSCANRAVHLIAYNGEYFARSLAVCHDGRRLPNIVRPHDRELGIELPRHAARAEVRTRWQ